MVNSFSINEVYDEIDLRAITAQSDFLRKVAKKHDLKHGECVVYTNAAQTRFRLVLQIQTMPLLCIPEIDDASKRSTYLRVSETLARLAGRTAQIKLEEIKKITEERIRKRQVWERMAMKRA